MKKLPALAAAALTLLTAGTLLYYTRSVDVLGHEVSVNAAQITFSGQEIPDPDALAAALAQLPYLEAVDLGDFHLYEEQMQELSAALPQVAFTYVPYRRVAGQTVTADIRSLDLSDHTALDAAQLCEELAGLPQLQTVDFGDHAVHEQDLARLQTTYPAVHFMAVPLYTVAGQELRADVQHIDLSGAAVPADLEQTLAQFPQLTQVDLLDTDIPVEELLRLQEAFPEIHFLAEVPLAGIPLRTDVQQIDLNSVRIRDYEGLFAALALFYDLQTIEMCDTGLSNDQMAALRDAYPATKFVWRIHMGRWSLRTDAVAFSVLIYRYDYQRLTNKDIEVLKYCTDLQALDIGHQAVTDLSVIGEYLTDLRILILADNSIRDLSPLANLKHLHYLEFFVNGVTDLSPLAQCKELVDLNISYNYRIRDITPLLDLPLLERLWLERVAVSSKDVALLRETYPEAKIVSEGKGSVDQGWRTHPRYFAMIDMYHKHNYISELFSKYDDMAA